MRYTLGAVTNLVTLVIGISIGILLAPRLERTAEAKGSETQATAGTNQVAGGANVTQIQPVMSVGSIGAYQILSHHIQTDEFVVNGLDLLKLQQGELNLLAGVPGIYPSRIQAVIDEARNTQLYQVASPNQSPNAKPTGK